MDDHDHERHSHDQRFDHRHDQNHDRRRHDDDVSGPVSRADDGVGLFGAIAVETTAVRPLAVPRRGSTHRQFVRVPAEAVLLKLRVGQGALVARVVDISLGGCFADVSHTIPAGAFVELALLSPGDDEIALGGLVVTDDERRGLAIRFATLGDHDARRLRRLIEAQLARHDAAQAELVRRDVDRDDHDRAEHDGRDEELARLRAQVSALRADNALLQHEVRANADAVLLVGRLQLEVERLRRRVDDEVRSDVTTIAGIERDAEVACKAIARVTDAIARLR